MLYKDDVFPCISLIPLVSADSSAFWMGMNANEAAISIVAVSIVGIAIFFIANHYFPYIYKEFGRKIYVLLRTISNDSRILELSIICYTHLQRRARTAFIWGF